MTQAQALSSLPVHPIGETAAVGPWELSVVDVVGGEEAASLMLETNAENPVAPDGYSYVLARITARNTSDRPQSIQLTDFAATGSDGILRRTQAVVVPSPMLQAVVGPGEATEGWIAPIVDDLSSALLWFDSPFLGGDWASALFALADGATLADPGPLDAAETDAGSDPTAPATVGETVRVGGWDVTITDVIDGSEVFERSDFRFRALGSDNSWVQRTIGLYATVRNLNAFPAFFSPIAFELADAAGEPWDHTLTMTGPEPDVSREYLPGASGEGWTSLSPGSFADTLLVRVTPFRVGGASRYIALDPDAVAAAQANAAADDTGTGTGESTPALDAAPGATVVTAEDRVNLRDAPSTTGQIVRELERGTELVVTGEPTDADGYLWYPVDVVETGESGFVAGIFLQASPN